MVPKKKLAPKVRDKRFGCFQTLIAEECRPLLFRAFSARPLFFPFPRAREASP